MELQTSRSVGLEETTPGLTPLIGENREDALYKAWKTAEGLQRDEVSRSLLQSVRRHASKVCWMVLHSHQPDLIDEIASDVVMQLESFRGESAFSTWVHARAKYRCSLQLKQIKQRKEVSLDKATESIRSSEVSPDTKIFVQEILNRLKPFDRRLIELKLYAGLSDEETAAELGYTRQWIQKRWLRLREKLKDRYNGSREVR